MAIIWDHLELSKYWSNICHPMGSPYAAAPIAEVPVARKENASPPADEISEPAPTEASKPVSRQSAPAAPPSGSHPEPRDARAPPHSHRAS